MIKVLIADDQELMRKSLQIILGMEADIEVIAAVENGTEVIRAVRREKPDVILMDIRKVYHGTAILEKIFSTLEAISSLIMAVP